MGRQGRTTVALAAGAVLFVAMAVFGWQRLTAPLPTSETATPEAPCQVYKTKKQVVRKEVTVSVYNGTEKSGLADDTMAVFERRNFVVGAVGNAPDGADVSGAQVRTTVEDDPRAQLVAEQFRPKADVEVVDEAMGPGIDVVLGPDFTKLRGKAPTKYVLPEPERTCVDRATPTAQPDA